MGIVMKAQDIDEKIKKLPPYLIDEVADYIDFLLSKHGLRQSTRPSETFTFAWEGSLSKLKGQFSSVELQHKATEWR
jgi:hypothetical protein